MIIKAVRSNKDTFKSVRFDTGFNVILAERTKDSSEKDSRNGLGKTTLIEIIHFCLGSDFARSSLSAEELKGWVFILDFNLEGKDYTAYRDTSNASVILLDGDFSTWSIQPEYDDLHSKHMLSNTDWCKVLGRSLFELTEEVQSKRYGPSFRSLISYFSRKGVEAYQNPFKFFPSQSAWSMQVNNSFLLGLNWEYAKDFQEIKDSVKEIESLKKVTGQGYFQDLIGSIGELESLRITKREELKSYQENQKSFKVHPEYYKIQEQADELTKKIQALVNKRHFDKILIDNYQQATQEEQDISTQDVQKVYEEAGSIFSPKLVRKLNEVKTFHAQLVKNRQSYLEVEIKRLKDNIDKMELEIENFSNERAELLAILSSHGALDEYAKLNERLARFKKETEDIDTKIKNLKSIEDRESELGIENQELMRRARQDKDERNDRVESAVKFFNHNSKFLYSEPGTLSVDITNVGYKFNVDIKRARSQGIAYMKVFCYDLMINQLQSKFFSSKFLIHDSTIFDGVDERQFAKALELAAQESKDKKFQYICALNSDVVPYEDFSPDFKKEFQESIKLRLTDSTPEGCLLGFRF